MAISDYDLLSSLSSDDTFIVAKGNTLFKVGLGELKADLQNNMLYKDQGRNNAGKILMVGPDGIVRPAVYEEEE